jgi:hypothetical protein
MKAPKMLPWLARKAGISEEHAEQLWAEAVVCATVQTGWVGTSEYWRAAVDRLVELIELESQSLRKTTIEHESVGYPARRPSVVMVGRNQSLHRNSETVA